MGNNLLGMGAADTVARNLAILMAEREDLSSGPKLAAKSGVSQKTINNIQRRRNSTTLITLEKIAKVFKVDPLLLLCPPDKTLLAILDAYVHSDERGRSGLMLAAEMAKANKGQKGNVSLRNDPG